MLMLVAFGGILELYCIALIDNQNIAKGAPVPRAEYFCKTNSFYEMMPWHHFHYMQKNIVVCNFLS